jgi:hypothetical protein
MLVNHLEVCSVALVWIPFMHLGAFEAKQTVMGFLALMYLLKDHVPSTIGKYVKPSGPLAAT